MHSPSGYTGPNSGNTRGPGNEGQQDPQFEESRRAVEYLLHDRKSQRERAEFHLTQGRIYLKRGEFREAIAAFTAAIDVDPSSFEAWFSRGLAHWGIKDPSARDQDFHRAHAIDPTRFHKLKPRLDALQASVTMPDRLSSTLCR